MKHVCAFAFLIIFAVLSGCTPSYRIQTDADNYREHLTIEKNDYDFYKGDYVGSEKNCFPPIENRICPNYTKNEVYKPLKELRMELFSISIKDTSVMTSKVVEDMAYLTAAELTEQRGFKTFTIPYTIENYSCSSIRSVNTYGTVYGNIYSGTSYLNNENMCVNSYSIEVLLYDDQDDLRNGILYRNNDNLLSSNKLYPFRYLYSGTTPGLEDEFLKQELEFLQSRYPVRFKVARGVWKTHYDIKNMAEELKKKYGLTKKIPYTFVDEREKHKKQNEQKNADPIEKYKLTK